MMTRTVRLLTACAVAVAIATPATAAEEKKAVSDPAIAEIDKFIADQKIDKSNPKWKESLPKPPKATFPKDKHYTWVLETNKGTIKIALKPELVVALGATAAQSVMGQITPINKNRGHLIEREGGPRILITVHPSYLLRRPDPEAKATEYRRFVEDLGLVAHYLKTNAKAHPTAA